MEIETREASATTAPVVDRGKLEKSLRSGAHWFYWIAGLSLINSILQMTGSDRSFVFGLAFTQVVDAIAKGAGKEGVVLQAIAFGIDLLAAGFLVAMGWLAGKRHGWAFGAGMVVYGLDAVLLIVFKELLGVAFHAFALVGIFAGLAAHRKLRALEPPPSAINPRAITP